MNENENDNIHIKKIPSYYICEMAEELLTDDNAIVITVVGNSMYPFLRNKIDSVELYKVGYDQIKVNDIIFAKKNHKCILHRLYRKYPDSFIMLGDGNLNTDSIYSKNDLVCKARAIYRKDKRIDCASISFRVLSSIWKILKPFRKHIFKIYYAIRYK